MIRPPGVFDASESGSLESLLVSTENIYFFNLLAALDIYFIGLIYLHVIRVCLPVFLASSSARSFDELLSNYCLPYQGSQIYTFGSQLSLPFEFPDIQLSSLF